MVRRFFAVVTVLIVAVEPISVLVAAPSSVSGDTLVTGTVLANRLNVRARPGTRFEVVAELLRDESITVVKRTEEWLGIVVPRSAVAWVPSKVLDAAGKCIEESPVFSGPGAVYSPYATIEAGDRCQVRAVKDAMWTRIAPPATAVAWVSARYVELPVKVEKEVTPDESVASDDAGVEAASVETPPEPLTVYDIAPPESTADPSFFSTPRTVEKVGTVLRMGDAKSDWAYVLALQTHETYFPIAYLGGNVDLAKWEFRRVKVTGVQRWAEGWSRPLIEVERIVTDRAD